MDRRFFLKLSGLAVVPATAVASEPRVDRTIRNGDVVMPDPNSMFRAGGRSFAPRVVQNVAKYTFDAEYIDAFGVSQSTKGRFGAELPRLIPIGNEFDDIHTGGMLGEGGWILHDGNVHGHGFHWLGLATWDAFGLQIWNRHPVRKAIANGWEKWEDDFPGVTMEKSSTNVDGEFLFFESDYIFPTHKFGAKMAEWGKMMHELNRRATACPSRKANVINTALKNLSRSGKSDKL